MGNKVNSKNILFYLKVDGVYYSVFCGQGLDWRQSQEMIETTNVNSGSTTDYESGMSTAVCSVSGVHVLDNTDSRISWNYLQTLSIRRTKQDWKIVQTDDDGDIVVYTFQGLIQDGGFSKSIPGYSKSSVTIQVCGGVTMTTVDPPAGGAYEYISDSWTTTNGQNYISGASTGNYNNATTYTLLATDEIMDVVVEGAPFYQVSGTPASGEAEFFFNTSPVRIEFPSTLVFDGSQRVFVMFRRPL